MLGTAITHWTIRLALLCLVSRWGIELFQRNLRGFQLARAFSTVGCLLFIAHVTAAFHFYHFWSHAAAFEKTAQETEAMLGMRFGFGIYFSYLFLLIWLGDTLWQWLAPENYRNRSRGVRLAVVLYLAFIALNGALVFEAGVTRTVGIPITLGLLAALLVAGYRQRYPAEVGEDRSSANLAGDDA